MGTLQVVIGPSQPDLFRQRQGTGSEVKADIYTEYERVANSAWPWQDRVKLATHTDSGLLMNRHLHRYHGKSQCWYGI